MTNRPDSASISASVSALVLAAGSGTRMKSALPKPLHPVAGLPMIGHVLRAVASLGPASITIVGSPELESAMAEGIGLVDLPMAIQDPPLGTGHAVTVGMEACEKSRWTLVVYADHPLVTGDELAELVRHAEYRNSDVCLLTCMVDDAAGYGRIARNDFGHVEAIIERIDDDPKKRTGTTEINTGIMVLDSEWASAALKTLEPHATKGEYFLTDLVERAASAGPGRVHTVTGKPDTLLGVNNREELALVDSIMRERIRTEHMLDGVTMIGADSILIDVDVEIGADTELRPNVFLGRNSRIGASCRIGPGSQIEHSSVGDGSVVELSVIRDSTVGANTHVGPYSHVRAGSEIGDEVHIGNFGEIKNTRIGSEVRSGHFSYLGDASIGTRTNIGAGTVTCNFDGINKHHTEIGDDVFVGSDSMLVAPIKLGDGSRTGAGSVVTKDVDPGATVAGVPARQIRRQKQED